MILNLDRLPRVIPVGIQTEQGVESIGFDLSPWVTRWPGMTFAVWATRPGEDAAYAAANTELVGNVLYWYPNATDTEKEGAGTVEIVGVCEGKTKSSGPVDTLVKKTTLDVTQETPEPIVPWFQELQKTAGVAQQGAAEAAASAQSAAQSAETAAQSSANADAKAQKAQTYAQAAKQSETNAANHAESASKSEQTAIANADDAESFAKDAQASAEAAATSAESAGASAQSASNSAEAASASAKEAAASAREAKDTAEAMTKGVQGADGRGGLFLVTVDSGMANRTQKEIIDAASYGADGGKTCILTDSSGRVYTYYGRTDYWGDAAEVQCPTFIRYERTDKGIAQYEAHVLSTGQVHIGYQNGVAKTPNPNALTLRKGNTDITYDGSKAATVDVPDVLIVTCDMSLKSSHTNGEVKSAASAGTAVFMVYNGNPFNLIGWTDGLANFERLYRAPLPGEAMTAIYYMQATLQSNKTFDISGDIPATTPNPMPLEFTGAVTASYDGTEPVQIEIPQGGSGGGIADPGVPNQQLVSDAEGKAVWQDIPEAVQSDWSQMDEAAKDYVKNRTHYDVPRYEFPEGMELPDSNTRVRLTNTEVSATGYNNFVKVSSIIPSVEDVKRSGAIGWVGGWYDVPVDIINETEYGFAVSLENYGNVCALICAKPGYTAEWKINWKHTATIDEPGVYVVESSANLGVSNSSSFAWGGFAKELEDKFLPANIVREEQLNDKLDELGEALLPEVNAAVAVRVDKQFNLFGKTVNLPETVVQMSSGTGAPTIPWAAPIVVGKTYTVTANGESIAFPATPAAADSGLPEGVITLGNAGYLLVYYIPEGTEGMDGVTAVVNLPGYTGEITLSIVEASTGYYFYDGGKTTMVSLKELREKVFSPGVILDETTVEGAEGELYLWTPLSDTPEAGTTYTVTYNGTPYDCPALYFEVEGLVGVALGNTDALDMPGGNTDAPFVALLIPDGADQGDGVMMYGIIMDMATGATSATLSIVEAGGAEYMTREQVVELINEMMGGN